MEFWRVVGTSMDQHLSYPSMGTDERWEYRGGNGIAAMGPGGDDRYGWPTDRDGRKGWKKLGLDVGIWTHI